MKLSYGNKNNLLTEALRSSSMPLPSLQLYLGDSFFSLQTERFVKYKPDNWSIYHRHATSENNFNGYLVKRILN